MVKPHSPCVGCLFILFIATGATAQQAGGIRGMIYDKDFDAPLGAVDVSIAETGQSIKAADEGNYVFGELPPGAYTLIFSKEGYARQVRSDVVVAPGQLTEVDASLSGEFTDMEEFVVDDVQLDSEFESDLFEMPLLELRLESPALMDSVSSDLMSQAGASDAASALTLVAGASIQDGKFAVVRGLPDRYVVSQLNGVRMPTADAEKRAVELDQFPSAAIESIQVSKTFTPDQQGDASGGAVNLVLKGVPKENLFKFSAQSGYNTQVKDSDFLTYQGGGLNFWGRDQRDIPLEDIGGNWDGAVGVSTDGPPKDSKWSLDAGGVKEIEKDFKIGGLASFFYERDSAYFNGGIEDRYWVEQPGGPMVPQTTQATPEQGQFKSQLFDVTQGSEEVKWGGLGVLGIETEKNKLTLANFYSRAAESVATLAEDTRGKGYFFPGYDPTNPNDPGNLERDAAPYLRTETLEYTERTTQSLQLRGEHILPGPTQGGKYFTFLDPIFDWTLSKSSADLYQPDKRQFGSQWWADSFNPGFPPFIPPGIDPAVHRPYKPAANFTVGNLQRIWKEITEESDQYALNLKLPFEQWSGDEGYFKFGIFNDEVRRDYYQESFSNFNDNSAQYFGSFDDFWSASFPDENHPITGGEIDVDYLGEQQISAWYYMIDMPVNSKLKFIGGARFEDTELSIVNSPESDVTWIPPGSSGQVTLNPGDADVAFKQSDVLPSIGFVLTPSEKLTLRGSYTETVARQTFRELSPIQQQEFLGGDVFIGNPFLRMSALKNYDLRLDYTPYEGGLYSISYFLKDIKDPIEYVQRIADFGYTTPINYPDGTLSGIELEMIQDVGRLMNCFEGLTVRANATFIQSEVTLPDEEAALFDLPNIQAPTNSRHMTNAPEHLYNLFLTYNLGRFGLEGTEAAVSYTVRGDTLIAGAGQSRGNYVPDVYEKEFGTLNVSLTQKIGESMKIKLQAKNLTDPDIETVYRSRYIDGDVTKTSYQKGMEFNITVSAEF